MRTLEGGCSVPIGANSSLKGGNILTLRGLVASLDGQKVVEHEDQVTLDASASLEEKEKAANELGKKVAEELIDLGAGAILKELAHN